MGKGAAAGKTRPAERRPSRSLRAIGHVLILSILFAAAAPAAPPSSAFEREPADRGKTGGAAGSVLPEAAYVSERVFGLPGLANVGRVAPGIYRGAQPQPEGYATLSKMGIRTVINLRARHGETKSVEAAGMRSIEVPMDVFEEVSGETVRQAVALMTDRANQPVYIHCQLGQDRTGVVVAIYRMDVEGWTLNAAEAEMQAFGFNDVWINLKGFVRRFDKK